jgi:hypothetical protein
VALAGALDTEVRRFVYDVAIGRGLPPQSAEVAEALGVGLDQARAAFERLAEAHVVVLQRDTREILMAMPFSAVATTFAVRAGDVSYHANCAWDALGVLAMAKKAGRVTTSCGCCGSAMALDVLDDRPPAEAGLVHFAVPARRFWDNIVFT